MINVRLKIKKIVLYLKYRSLYPKIRFSSGPPLYNFRCGKNSYGTFKVINFGREEEALYINDYVSIAREVEFILGGDHYHKGISTFPFEAKLFSGELEAITKGPIIVESDVWIGRGATILSGVNLAQGTIIGAKAVISKSTEPYGIYVGNPGKLVGYRHDDRVIEKILKYDISDLLDYVNKIKGRKFVYEKLDEESLDELLKGYSEVSV